MIGILRANRINKGIDCLLHRILTTFCIVICCITFKVICHRTGLVKHQYDIQQLCADCLSHLIRKVSLQCQLSSCIIDGFFDVNKAVILRDICNGIRRPITRRYDRHQPNDHQYGHNERQHSSHFHRKIPRFSKNSVKQAYRFQ